MTTSSMDTENPVPPVTETDPNIRQIGSHKLKLKKPLQRSCNEKDAKGKVCGGHLKRWFYDVDTVEQECGDLEREFGKRTEMYRCENCRTLYLPNPEDPTGKNVAGKGRISVFGLTIGAKEEKKA